MVHLWLAHLLGACSAKNCWPCQTAESQPSRKESWTCCTGRACSASQAMPSDASVSSYAAAYTCTNEGVGDFNLW
ncbi:hypothetical protein WJX77_002950 [Trebouxia sp. C0004]